uniref:NADH-ubiquinone oxidoreductase chain 1 n=1 Tax=Hypochilus thorelli TaxID=139869 RepID=B2CKU3_HYPTH|nr:NADH dehydrogenase subunit 1 [Hypochilus thorelli]ACA62655.1 NADH dehydrogenase subunit 1 [Hypochilus thorelli]
MLIINLMLITLPFLVSIAFYTILERKILSYIQIRKGPNKVGFLGILQPFSDAIKLFNKSIISTELMNYTISYITPASTFMLSLLVIPMLPYSVYSILDNKFSLISLLVVSSMSVYSILMISWSANSKYSHLGSVRSLAQMISYEVSFFLILLSILMFFHSYNMAKFYYFQNFLPIFLGTSPIFLMWLISCVAETNRSPLDFAEGESELVSGFNVEYMGGWFAMIFLAEYASMLILMTLTIIMFFNKLTSLASIMIMMFLTSFILWLRGTFPRFRYDLLMSLNWLNILPLILILMLPLITFNFFFF